MVERFAYANYPSPTPPHKGKGLDRRNLSIHFKNADEFILGNLFSCMFEWNSQKPLYFAPALAAGTNSPSPLWGGVGEGRTNSLYGVNQEGRTFA